MGRHHRRPIATLRSSLVPAAVLVLVAACAAPASRSDDAPRAGAPPHATDAVSPASGRGGAGLRVAFLDGVEVGEELTWTAHPVAVTDGPATDTIADLLALDPVRVIGDTLVRGFGHGPAADTTAPFEYDLRARRLRWEAPLPAFTPLLGGLAVSPTGEFVAFVKFDGDFGAWGTVRRWGDWQELHRTQPLRAGCCDDFGAAADWAGPRAPVFYLDQSAEHTHWTRIHASLDGAPARVDTVAVEELQRQRDRRP